VSATRLYADYYMRGAMHGAVVTASGVAGACIVFHGPSGCYTVATHLRTDQAFYGGAYTTVVPSGPLEPELIMGFGVDKAREAAEFGLATAKPSILFIINTTPTSITGDNIKGVAVDLEEKFKVPAIALDVPGHKGGFATGSDITMSALLDKFATEGGTKESDAVNIIGPFLSGSRLWQFDYAEAASLLQRLGLKVNCTLTRNTPLKDIQSYPKAQLDLLFTYEPMPLLSEHSRKFGISRLPPLPLPYGLANTEEWMMAIAKEFGRTDRVEKALREDVELIRSVLRFNYNYTWFNQIIMQRHIGLAGDAPFAASLARFFYYDLNVYPDVIALYAETHEALKAAHEVLKPLEEEQPSIEILDNPLQIELARKVKEAKVDFFVGTLQEKALMESINIPCLVLGGPYFHAAQRYVPWPYLGYKGILNLYQELTLLEELMIYEKDKWKAMKYDYI
jgi:nitrogenase molybdenum-iron protein alpha/beta subunit